MNHILKDFEKDGFVIIKKFILNTQFDIICEKLNKKIEIEFNKIDKNKLGGSLIGNLALQPGNYTKKIDSENEKGFYTVYKQIVNRLSGIIKEINPNYEYPHMLISSTIDGALHQRYFSQHFPSLIDNNKMKDCVSSFYTDLVFNAVK